MRFFGLISRRPAEVAETVTAPVLVLVLVLVEEDGWLSCFRPGPRRRFGGGGRSEAETGSPGKSVTGGIVEGLDGVRALFVAHGLSTVSISNSHLRGAGGICVRNAGGNLPA